MATFTFDYDPKYSELGFVNSLLVVCEIEFKTKEEYEVTYEVFGDDESKPLDLKTLDIRDRAMISDRAWTPPSSTLGSAASDQIEGRAQHYDKYESL